jgi:hypothetical protein
MFGLLARFKWYLMAGLLIVGTVIDGKAQPTNRVPVRNVATSRLLLTTPAFPHVLVTNLGKTTSIEFKLPQELSHYQVTEIQAQSLHSVSTNRFNIRNNTIRTEIAPGNMLILIEKNSAFPTTVQGTNRSRVLFSTMFIKPLPPLHTGDPVRAASGSLYMTGIMPIAWDVQQNAYVAKLWVEFDSADESPVQPLLPMTVHFGGENTTGITPDSVQLMVAGANGAQEITVTCKQYQPQVQLVARYQMTNSTCNLMLQPLTVSTMIQMVISKPMLFVALVGGFLGGTLRVFKYSRWSSKLIVRFLVEGMLVGLITVIMLLAGLLHKLLDGIGGQSQLTLAFGLATAAGSVGAHFLDAYINSLWKGKTSSS